jgi:lactoylglutathione lyase
MEFHHISITVKNLNESIKFYTEVFGFKFHSQFSKDEGNTKFAYLKSTNLTIELWEFKNPTASKDDLTDLKRIGYGHLAFSTNSIDQLCDRLNDLDLDFSPIKVGASGKKFSLGKDINGISIEIIES